eukprot:scaffold1698_cov394-Pavlova_lutheri.AAC.2
MDVGVVVSVEMCKLFPFVAMIKNRLRKHEAFDKNLITMCITPNLKDTEPVWGLNIVKDQRFVNEGMGVFHTSRDIYNVIG